MHHHSDQELPLKSAKTFHSRTNRRGKVCHRVSSPHTHTHTPAMSQIAAFLCRLCTSASACFGLRRQISVPKPCGWCWMLSICFQHTQTASFTHKRSHYAVITASLMLRSPSSTCSFALISCFSFVLLPSVLFLSSSLQTVSILEQRLTLTENKLKECVDNQKELAFQLKRREEA